MDANNYHEALKFIASLAADLQTALYRDDRRGVIPPEDIVSTFNIIDHTSFIVGHLLDIPTMGEIDKIVVNEDADDFCDFCGPSVSDAIAEGDEIVRATISDDVVAEWPEDDSHRVPGVCSFYDSEDDLQVRWYNHETKQWQDERPADQEDIDSTWKDDNLPF
jgi:hypothetical protein